MAKQHLSLPGILVDSIPLGKHITFMFLLSNGSPANPMFFTSPALREALKKINYKEGEFIGSIQYTASSAGYGDWIYPFGQHEKLLEKKGIAKGLESITLRELRKHAGKNVPVFPSLGAGPERAIQVRRRGVKVDMMTPNVYYYKSSADDMRRRINEAKWKYRKTHRLTRPSSGAGGLSRMK